MNRTETTTIETRLRLRYGLNEADSWWHFARGPHRARIQARLQELRPDIVRIFLYDKGTPDPVEDWESFVAYVEAVRKVGAVPMVTFACGRVLAVSLNSIHHTAMPSTSKAASTNAKVTSNWRPRMPGSGRGG